MAQISEDRDLWDHPKEHRPGPLEVWRPRGVAHRRGEWPLGRPGLV